MKKPRDRVGVTSVGLPSTKLARFVVDGIEKSVYGARKVNASDQNRQRTKGPRGREEIRSFDREETVRRSKCVAAIIGITVGLIGWSVADAAPGDFTVVHFIGDGFALVPPLNQRTGTNPPETCSSPCEVVSIPRGVPPPLQFPTVPNLPCEFMPAGCVPGTGSPFPPGTEPLQPAQLSFLLEVCSNGNCPPRFLLGILHATVQAIENMSAGTEGEALRSRSPKKITGQAIGLSRADGACSHSTV
jgi:hypothetical protein